MLTEEQLDAEPVTKEAPAEAVEVPELKLGPNGLPDIPELQTKLELLEDYLLVQRLTPEEESSGSHGAKIILAGTARTDRAECLVVAVGPGKTRDDGSINPMGIIAGETILLAKYAGHEHKENGQDRLIIRRGDVLAKVLD